MFKDYYESYLNITAGVNVSNCLVCKSPDRDVPLNKRYSYKIIISDYRGERIVSVSPEIPVNIISNLCADMKERSFEEILQSEVLHKTGYRLNIMYRMVLRGNKIPESNITTALRAEYLSDYYKYVIREKEEIISYCKVSNIDYNYGNIVVWTHENYRRKGFAKELLLQTLSMCEKVGIQPLYLVKSENTASLELAKSVGFRAVQTEIIACKEIDL